MSRLTARRSSGKMRVSVSTDSLALVPSRGNLVTGGCRSIMDDVVGVSDMVLLDPVTEEALINNLKERFMAEKIYTYIGSVVISINPYQIYEIYNKDIISEYRSRNIYEMPPHVYAIADNAYRSMRDTNRDQCILITGESGAGKTEASKIVMQFVAAVSGKGKEVNRVKEQLLQSTPVLEAFGNAKTNRNDNSSRFGKYMDIEFDFKGDPAGGLITNYLLEKSRVIHQIEGERNFHIFYQLLCGGDDSLLGSIYLKRTFDSYHYLNESGCVDVETIDDKKDFKFTRRGMEVVGFSDEEVHGLFEIIAAILHLGNVCFDGSTEETSSEAVMVKPSVDFQNVCKLLSCKISDLENALTVKTVDTGKEKVKTSLNHAKAVYARDALAKALYDRIFTWLVSRINDSISVKSKGKRKVIGVLDIYGFEIFEQNSFEQFIINYCNEKLQQLFIELTLQSEQAEYVREGIEWTHIDFFNNAVIVELIEGPGGIVDLLDEECIRPGDVSDEHFLEKMNTNCISHAHFESRKKLLSEKTLPYDVFRLIHYAGKVSYNVKGFLDKNNDLLHRDLAQAMYSCDKKLLATLFPDGAPEKASKKRAATAVSQFKVSVSELMKNMMSKRPNYIRCIKPNVTKSPGVFDIELVRHQARYLGLIENIRVRRAGFAYRQEYEVALNRYKMLCSKTWPNWRNVHKSGVEALLKELQIPEDEYKFGRTKIFIRNPQTLFDLEDMRREKMHDLVTLILKTWRGYAQWKKYQQMRKAEIIISKYARCFLQHRKYKKMQAASILIQSFVRGWKARRLYKQMQYKIACIWASGIIKKYFYGWQARKAYQQALIDRKFYWAATTIRKNYLCWKVRKEYSPRFRKNAAPKVQKFFRSYVRYKFLMNVKEHLPTNSPTDNRWHTPTPMFKETSDELKRIHHMWRCRKHRQKFDDKKKLIYEEKLKASELFKGKKDNYPASVGEPYLGDRVGLPSQPKWNKVVTANPSDVDIVWADHVMKINRRNGKGVPHVLAVSTTSLLVLDGKSCLLKHKILLQDVQKISVSPFKDGVIVFNIRQVKEDKALKKGDFIIHSAHVIELVMRTYYAIHKLSKRSIPVQVTDKISAHLAKEQLELSFKPSPVDVIVPMCKKTSTSMEVLF